MNGRSRQIKVCCTGDIKKGQKLFEIRDFFGNLIEEIHAKFDGHVVIVSNTLGVNVGDDLITYGEIEE